MGACSFGTQSKLWPYALSTLCERSFRRIKSVDLHTIHTGRFAIFKDQIYIPCVANHEPRICVYTASDLELRETIELPKHIGHPNSIALIQDPQSGNMQECIIVSETGLYSMPQSRQFNTLQCGNFADVCCYDNKLYSLEYSTLTVDVRPCNVDCDVAENKGRHQSIQLKECDDGNEKDSILVANGYINVMSYTYDKMYRFSMEGEKISEHGAQVSFFSRLGMHL